MAYLSTVECGIGITAVSLGTLKPLVEQLRGRRGTTTASSSNGASASWSRRNRSDLQGNSYIRAHGSERTTTPESRFGNNLNISKESNQSSSHTLSSFIRGNQDGIIQPANTRETRAGITKTVELTQSHNESARTRNSARFSIRIPSAVVISNRVFVSQASRILPFQTNSLKFNDPATVGEGSPRTRRFAPFPSLFSALHSKRQKSTPSTNAVPPSPSSAHLTLFSRPRTNEDENAEVQVELSPV